MSSSHVLVSAACIQLGLSFCSPSSFSYRWTLRQFQHLVVVVIFLEVFAVGEEVEELVGGLLGLGYACFQVLVEKLLEEIMLACAATLDLNEVGRGENWPEQADIEHIRAVVTCGHHADGHANAGLACFVAGDKIARPQQVVIAEIDRELLGVCNLGCHLNGKVGLVLAGEHHVGHFVEHLR